jgi:CRP-like cAMP-binding protein
MIEIMSEFLQTVWQALDARPRRFCAGEGLFAAGDAVERMHLLTLGTVHLERPQASGQALILHRAGSGEMLAEASLYASTYHCSARALTPGESLSVPRPALRAYLSATPERADRWAAHLAREIQQSRVRAEILALPTVATRLDAWLEWQNTDLPEKGGWSRLAAELAVSPESLYREIAKRRK